MTSAAFLPRPLPRIGPLQGYLNDHLAGAAGAIGLVEMLRDVGDGDSEFFADAARRIRDNRSILLKALAIAGCQRSRLRELLGRATSFAGQLRLRISGLRAGDLGRLEALELLALGVEGQCALWSFLWEASQNDPAWEDFDFAGLKDSARHLHNEVEKRHEQAFREVWHESRPGL